MMMMMVGTDRAVPGDVTGDQGQPTGAAEHADPGDGGAGVPDTTDGSATARWRQAIVRTRKRQ